MYFMEVSGPFRYWTLWISKRHTVRLHHILTVYNDMFDRMEGVMWALAKNKTQWKEDVFFAVKLARQMLSKWYAEVTPSTGTHLISAHILDPFRKLRSFRMWSKGMDINPGDEAFYNTQYPQAFLQNVEDEFCAKQWHVMVNKHESLPTNNLIPSAMALGSCQSSFDPYDLCSDDE